MAAFVDELLLHAVLAQVVAQLGQLAPGVLGAGIGRGEQRMGEELRGQRCTGGGGACVGACPGARVGVGQRCDGQRQHARRQAAQAMHGAPRRFLDGRSIHVHLPVRRVGLQWSRCVQHRAWPVGHPCACRSGGATLSADTNAARVFPDICP